MQITASVMHQNVFESSSPDKQCTCFNFRVKWFYKVRKCWRKNVILFRYVCVLFILRVSLSVYLHSALTTLLIQKVSRINQLSLAGRDTTLSVFLRQLRAKVERPWANSAGRATNRIRQNTFSAETSPTQVITKTTRNVLIRQVKLQPCCQ